MSKDTPPARLEPSPDNTSEVSEGAKRKLLQGLYLSLHQKCCLPWNLSCRKQLFQKAFNKTPGGH